GNKGKQQAKGAATADAAGRRFTRRALLAGGLLGCGAAAAGAVWLFTRGNDVAPAEHTCEVVRTYPHDRDAYTQGLAFEDGFLYEGTGKPRESSLRKVDLETGRVLRRVDLGDEYF